jgi:Glycosyltransferase like family 2
MLSILLPINQHTEYFYVALDSLIKSVEPLNIPTQLVVILNKLNQEDKKLVYKDLNSYPFEKIIKATNANNLSEVLNYGLSFCIFDLVARMDGDDVSLPNRFVEQVSFLENNPDISLVGGQVELINSSGKKIGTARYPVGPKNIHKSLRYKNCFAHPALMYRKSIILKIGGYSNIYPFAEDYDLWVRLSKVTSLENSKSLVLKYRKHDSQISTRNSFLQLKSTIKIMAYQFGISDEKLNQDFESIDINEKKRMIRKILSFSSIRYNRQFRAAIALMILRQDSGSIVSSFFRYIYLISISVYSDPITTFKSISELRYKLYSKLTNF